MRRNFCKQEELVHRACSTGEWPDALRAHTTTCPECHVVVEIFEWMQHQAQDELQHSLPEAGTIWWKAQLMRRSALEQKAIRPVQTFQRAAFSVTALVLISLGIWRWPSLEKWLGVWTPSLERSWWTLTNLSPVFSTLLLVSVSMIGLSVLLTFFAVLSED
jgi:hypothetical protein